MVTCKTKITVCEIIISPPLKIIKLLLKNLSEIWIENIFGNLKLYINVNFDLLKIESIISWELTLLNIATESLCINMFRTWKPNQGLPKKCEKLI